MNFRQLWYLQLIIAKGGFAPAAKEAGVSQPAITQAMQALEREWEVPLFEKVGRQKQPTSIALAMAQQAADLHGQLEKLARPGSSDLVPPSRSLRIGMAPAAALLYGERIERIWRQHEPEGLMQIVSGSAIELLSALHNGEIDLVAVPRPRRYQVEGVQQMTLHMSMPTIYARKGHPLLAAVSLQDIKRAGWAVSGRGGTAGNVIEEAHRVRRMTPPRILVQCADYTTVLDLVSKTDMLCVVPHPVLVQERHHEVLRPLKIREGLPQYEVCLFWRSAALRQNREVIDEVVSSLKSVEEPASKPQRVQRTTRA